MSQPSSRSRSSLFRRFPCGEPPRWIAHRDNAKRIESLHRFVRIPVARFGAIALFPEMLGDFLGHHHRAVMPTCAAKRNGEIAFSFADVMGDQIDKQILNTIQELNS